MNSFVLQNTLTESISTSIPFKDYPILQLSMSCLVAMIVSTLFQTDLLAKIKIWYLQYQKVYTVKIKYVDMMDSRYGASTITTASYNITIIKAIEHYGQNKQFQNSEFRLSEDMEGNNLYERMMSKKFNYIPTCKTLVEGYKNLWYQISIIESGKDKSTSLTYEIDFTSTVSVQHIHDFIRQCYEKYIEDNYEKTIEKEHYVFLNDEKEGQARFYDFKTNVTFDQIFFKGKDTLIKTIQDYQNGQLKKLVILLEDRPGTGKTSIIKSIANMTKRHIQIPKLSTIKSLDALIACFHCDRYLDLIDNIHKYIPTDQKIIVLEDLDRDCDIACKQEEPETEEDKEIEKCIKKFKPGISQSDLLQILDGIIELTSIVIITTNNVDKLTPALIRPGRVTLRMHIGYIDLPNAILLVQKIYKMVLTKSSIKVLEKHIEANITPAEIEMNCLSFSKVEDWQILTHK